MSSPLWMESLRRVLALEKEKGFSNRAVWGGMERYMARWAVEIAQALPQPSLRRRFEELRQGAGAYAGWGREGRERWVEEVLSLLKEAEGAGAGGGRAPPPPRPPPPLPHRTPRLHLPPSLPLDSPLTTLARVNAATARRFLRLGVRTLRDMLYFFPRHHLDYSQRRPIAQLEVGPEQTAVALVWEARPVSLGGRPSTEAVVGDETGNIRAVWFNQPYLAPKLTPNTRVVLSGRVGVFKGQKVFESPEWEPWEGEHLHTGRLVPVYPLTEGLRTRLVRCIAKIVVDSYAQGLADFLPRAIRDSCSLLPLSLAVAQAHFPDDPSLLTQAQRRLAFDELFLLQAGVLTRKNSGQLLPGPAFSFSGEVIEGFVRSLPFVLTGAQGRALREILSDLCCPQAMSRLLQGEVGSGKTVVAAAALVAAAASGYQGAFMAPTEVLAEQHFSTLTRLLSRGRQPAADGRRKGDEVPLRASTDEETFQVRCPGPLPRPLTLCLLTGSQRPRKKKELLGLIASGEADIVIGTHALVQQGVSFPRLGLAVVDEQHHFGVLQRSALRQKGYNPHMLVMSATPIPRTLALTLYGDLDLSLLDQLPPGRQRVKTRWLGPQRREAAYNFLRQRAAQGEQGFIICPLIEGSENFEAKAAVAEYQRLSTQVFPQLRLGLLHGRMKAPEKEAAMRSFRAGELNILVSTPVVEVGIDVPNATVMLVEGAERFGLSQLHQFRGRVGRGEKQSYCLLLSEDPSPQARERLKVVEEVYDGFALAQKDLELRGPGEFFGTRQSGLPELKMARLSDLPLLELAREQAGRLLSGGGGLGPALLEELRRRWPQGMVET